MRGLPVFLVFLLLLPGVLQQASGAYSRKPGKKILFLTNSTFHSHGGGMTPFNGYCTGAGVAYEAFGSYRYLRAARGGKRISPFLAGQIKDPRILELIGKGDFDYVVLVTRFSALATAPGARAEFSAFRKMHEHIVRSGARTVVSVSYVTRGSVHDRGRKANNRARHEELKTELNGMEIAGKKHPVILVPTGSLWSEGVARFGVEAWFADSVHGTPLAQHGSGCLFFTFITGQDPRKNGYLDLHAEARFRESELSREEADWLRERVWVLYQERGEKEEPAPGRAPESGG